MLITQTKERLKASMFRYIENWPQQKKTDSKVKRATRIFMRVAKLNFQRTVLIDFFERLKLHTQRETEKRQKTWFFCSCFLFSSNAISTHNKVSYHVLTVGWEQLWLLKCVDFDGRMHCVQRFRRFNKIPRSFFEETVSNAVQHCLCFFERKCLEWK